MASEFKVELISQDGLFSPIKCTGMSVTYAINTIPQMHLPLPPTAVGLTTDFEKYRRSNVLVKIETPVGAMDFYGFIDGLSTSHTVGSVGIGLIVKHYWAYMLECDSKFPGYQSVTSDVYFTPASTGDTNQSESVLDQTILGLLEDIESQNNPDMTAADGVKAIMQAVIKAKDDFFAVLQEATANAGDVIDIAGKVAEAIGRVYYSKIDTLLQALDVSFLSKMTLKFNEYSVSTALQQQLNGDVGSLQDLLMRLCQVLNLNLVITNKKAYLLPDIGFLTLPKRTPSFRAISTWPNVIFPAQYTSYQFDDSGVSDIKACVLTIPPMGDSDISPTTSNEWGVYVDENGKGGVKYMQAPIVVSLGSDTVAVESRKEVRSVTTSAGVTKREEVTSGSLTTQKENREQQAQTILVDAKDGNTKAKEYANKWAKIMYLQNKYKDRGGSISVPFTFMAAPGAVGSIYTRSAGMFIDFFVTAVRYDLSVAPNNQGSATTTINFNCGRVGASNSVDTIDVYGFSAQDSLNFAFDFVRNTKR